LGLVAFIASGLWVKDPIIDLSLFTNHNFMMTSIINFVRTMASNGMAFLIPLFLQNLMDYRALDTGIVLLPTALSMAAVSPFSGFISDRIGPKIPIFIGILLMGFSLYCYKDISINADYWFFFWPQILIGIGIGLINAPLVSASFNAIRQEQTSMASGLYNLIHQLGGAFGIAMLGIILQRREFFHYAHYGQQIRDVFSPSTSQALLTMQELLLRYGLEPTEVVAKGKSLLAQWVHGLAKVAAFQDAFIVAGLFVAVGVVPSLLIRTAQLSSRLRGRKLH
jgi:DHA2 family multidrug resistance protein